MKRQVGVWIDHRKACIVIVTPQGEHMALVIAHVESQPRREGDSPMKGSYEPLQVPADDRRQRALSKHRNLYYDAVVAAMQNADAFYLLGPGEAKVELKKRLAKAKLAARIASIETADKMTDRQIIAKVRKFFGQGAPARVPTRRRGV